MKVLVCGSRSWTEWHHHASIVYNRMIEFPPGTTILHGGARGADELAHIASVAYAFDEIIFRPDWDREGKKAGIMRNLRLLALNPDLVIAFWDGKSPGTGHVVKEARRRGLALEIIPGPPPDPPPTDARSFAASPRLPRPRTRP